MWREQPRRNGCGIAWAHSERRHVNNEIDVCKLRAQCSFLPWHCFQARARTKHTWPSKIWPQPLSERGCFCQSAIDKNKAFAILERTLPGDGVPRSAAGANNHYPQIAHLDREFVAN